MLYLIRMKLRLKAVQSQPAILILQSLIMSLTKTIHHIRAVVCLYVILSEQKFRTIFFSEILPAIHYRILFIYPLILQIILNNTIILQQEIWILISFQKIISD